MRPPLWILFLIVLFLAVGGVVIGLVVAMVTADYTSDQTVTRSFPLDEEFDVVARVLRQQGVSTEILNAAGTSEFVDEAWDDIDVGLEGFALEAGRPKLDLSFAREGTLRVRTLNEDIGRHVITLDRRVEVDGDHVQSDVKLREGTEKLVGYEMTTRFERPSEADGTQVEITLRQAVRTRAPFFLTSVADGRVRESAEAALAAQERAIREVLATRIEQLANAPPADASEGPLKKLFRGLLQGARNREGEAPAEP